MKKTLLASAILLATSSVAMAADSIDITNGENSITADVTESVTIQSKNGSNSSVYVNAGNDQSFSVKKGVTVTAKNIDEGDTVSKLAVMNAKVGGTVTNDGTIVLEGTEKNYWATKGLFADGGKAVNNGTIRVKNGVAMLGGTKAASELTNKGTIIVEGLGSAMEASANGQKQALVNEGTIAVTGKAFAIRASDGTTGSVITNTGVITGENAIYVGQNGDSTASGVTVNLAGKSHVEGLVSLNEKTTLNLDGVKGETVHLATIKDTNATEGAALTVNVKNEANVTLEQGTEEALTIGNMTVEKAATANFKLNAVGTEKAPVLSVATMTGEAAVGYSAAVSDQLLSGEADAKNLFAGVKLGDQTLETVTTDAGLEADAKVFSQDKDGNITETVTEVNPLIDSAQEVALASALMWRDQLSSLSDRMGTLRAMPSEYGAWARYTNGHFDGNDLEHDFNTVEVGFDKKISNTVALGASFAYTKGESDLIAGTADNNTYTGGLYATYMNESNCFLDAMFKIGRIDAEYDLATNAGVETADYMMTGTIFGVEMGHRWAMQNFYVEPQVQLTYSHLRPTDYTSSIDREVKYEAIESLIARVGVMGGMTFAEKGAAYAGVSYNHDFMGEVEGKYSLNSTRTFEDQLDENWAEAKLGASYQVTDGLNAFADAAMTFGGDIDQKWRFNVGARYVF